MSRELLDRMLKVIGLLSSSNSNEAGVAAGMLMQILKQGGLDVHDFMNVVAIGFSEYKRERRSDNDWRNLLVECLKHALKLSVREQEFLGSLSVWRGTPTNKQLIWLSDIHDKVRRFQ